LSPFDARWHIQIIYYTTVNCGSQCIAMIHRLLRSPVWTLTSFIPTSHHGATPSVVFKEGGANYCSCLSPVIILPIYLLLSILLRVFHGQLAMKINARASGLVSFDAVVNRSFHAALFMREKVLAPFAACCNHFPGFPFYTFHLVHKFLLSFRRPSSVLPCLGSSFCQSDT